MPHWQVNFVAGLKCNRVDADVDIILRYFLTIHLPGPCGGLRLQHRLQLILLFNRLGARPLRNVNTCLLPLCSYAKDADAAFLAEVPALCFGKGTIVPKLIEIRGRDQDEIFLLVDGSTMEEAHLLTCRAVAFVQANRLPGKVIGLVVVDGRKCEADLVLYEAAMARSGVSFRRRHDACESGVRA